MIDFSLLNSIAGQKPETQPLKAVSGEEYNNTQSTKQAKFEADFGDLEAIRKLEIHTNRKYEAQATYEQIFSTYQDNIRRAGQAKSDILKGLQNGEDIHSLFLKACECISAMTAEDLFKEQTAETVKKVYGIALQNKQPLLLELQEVQSRIGKLCDAIDRENDMEAVKVMQTALYNHLVKEKSLKEQLEKMT